MGQNFSWPVKKQKINVPKANEKSKRGKNKGVVDVKKTAVVSSKVEVKKDSSTKASKSGKKTSDKGNADKSKTRNKFPSQQVGRVKTDIFYGPAEDSFFPVSQIYEQL